MTRREIRCEYVTRRAGYTRDGRPIDTAYGGGATTEVCGKPGREVPHTYRVKRPGTTSVLDAIQGTAIRCAEHETV